MTEMVMTSQEIKTLTTTDRNAGNGWAGRNINASNAKRPKNMFEMTHHEQAVHESNEYTGRNNIR